MRPFQGKHDTPLTLKNACDVLCASASVEVLADLVTKFGVPKPLPPGTIGLFVYPKSIIFDKPKTKHTITAACWRDSCILLSADRTPLYPAKAKQIFETAFDDSDAEAKGAKEEEEEEREEDEEEREEEREK